METRSPGTDDLSPLAQRLQAMLDNRYRALKQELRGLEELLGIETEETRLRAENEQLKARLFSRRRQRNNHP